MYGHVSKLTGRVSLFLLGAAAGGASAQDNPFEEVSRDLRFERGPMGLFSEGLGGAAWFDYDGDDDLDLFLANRHWRWNSLFENDGNGAFHDVAWQAGVAGGRGATGVLAGDIDNDGCTDILLTGEGGVIGPFASSARLYVNNCDGTFTDISNTAGIPGPIPGMMAAFGDIDNDGDLDVFITSPGSFFTGQQTRNKLYLNNGDRTFSDISVSAMIDTALGACVVGFHDYDDDGWIDIFVGNCNDLDIDPTPFELFRNNHDLTFTDVAPSVGLDELGFWMAVAFGDYDGDGDLDLFSTSGGTSMPGEPYHALFRKNDDDTYTDTAAAAGVAAWEFGWGASFADFDNDGDEDLLFAGSFPPVGIFGAGSANPGRLFINDGKGAFSMVADFGLEWRYSSGLAVGDYDANGFPDAVIVTSRLLLPGWPLLLRNAGNSNHWLTVRAVGTVSNRSAVGARVRVIADGAAQIEEISAGSSFASTHSPWPTFGLGPLDEAEVQVAWPSGLVESFGEMCADQMVTVVEGTGTPVP